MTTPGFTAEASLGKAKKIYSLASETFAESGGVLPQFCFRPPGSSYTTCGGCIDTDGDGVADTCYYYSFRSVGIPYQ